MRRQKPKVLCGFRDSVTNGRNEAMHGLAPEPRTDYTARQAQVRTTQSRQLVTLHKRDVAITRLLEPGLDLDLALWCW